MSQGCQNAFLVPFSESENRNCLAKAENSFQVTLGLTKPFKYFAEPLLSQLKKHLYFGIFNIPYD